MHDMPGGSGGPTQERVSGVRSTDFRPMVLGACVRHTARMDEPTPFCDTCGRVGVSLTGMHPNDDGLVQWTLYRCGHVRTTLQLPSSESVSAR